MPTDLRAEVLAGIDQRILGIVTFDLPASAQHRLAEDARTALRHLREIVERHKMERDTWHEVEETFCGPCNCDWPCPFLVSLAPDYAPQALAKMEAEK